LYFRSQSKLLIHAKVNKIYLCPKHHRGDNGPHHNKITDDRYKRQVQEKLLELFENDYYKQADIKELLDVSIGETQRITKHLTVHKQGYKNKEIVFHLLGDRWFV